MLRSPELEMLPRDPGLPGLRVVLDSDALVTALRARFPSLVVEEARRTYVRYKPFATCLAAHSVRVDGVEVVLHAVAHRADDRRVRRQLERSRPTADGFGTSSFSLDRHSVAVHVFPADPVLPALARLADPEQRRRLLQNLLPEAALSTAQVRVMQYKPQRRLVAQVAVGGRPVAAIKLHAPLDFARPAIHRRWHAAGGGLAFAPVLGVLERRGAIAHRWITDEQLSESLRTRAYSPVELPRVGAAIAELHAMPVAPTALPRQGAGEIGQRLLAHATTTAFLLPAAGARAMRLARRVARALVDAEPVRPVPIHGDCYAKQFLLGTDAVTMLDLDEAAFGAPSVDIGNFVAHLERDALRGGCTHSQALACTEALLHGYDAAAGARPRAFAPHVAAGLVLLSHHPFRHGEPEWEGRLLALIECGERWMARARRNAAASAGAC